MQGSPGWQTTVWRSVLVNIGVLQYFGRVASELVSLADASAMLGVSAERVRQLVIAGALPGVRFGNAWAVPKDAVAARRHQLNRRGRPLSAKRAWTDILNGRVDLAAAGRYRDRAQTVRYRTSAGDIAHLNADREALTSGVAAAAAYGQLLAPEGAPAELYLPSSALRRLLGDVVAIADPLGAVALRVVPADAWAVLHRSPGRDSTLAPRAAVALDLMESNDPRHWIAAEQLLGGGDG